MSTPTGKKPSPRRGLVVGLILVVILFPSARHLVFSSVEAVIGIILGALCALALYTFAAARR